MKMRFILFILFLPMLVKGQGDFSFLKKELNFFKQNDTVMVFGIFNSYSGSYVLATAEKCKFVEFTSREGKLKKVFDSSSVCSDCSMTVDFTKTSFSQIVNNLDSGSYFWLRPRNVNGKEIIDIASHIGPAFFLGIYSRQKKSYSFFDTQKNINHVFSRGGYYYWMYFNLVRNQWPQFSNPKNGSISDKQR